MFIIIIIIMIITTIVLCALYVLFVDELDAKTTTTKYDHLHISVFSQML